MNKIVIADNHALYRAGAAKFLAMEDDLRIVGQYADAERFLISLDSFRGVIFIFASSLKLDASMLVPRIKATNSRALVIVENGEAVQPWLNAGVRGATDRNVSVSGLIECAHSVCRGERVVRTSPTGQAAANWDSAGARVLNCLKPKELKIVGLIAQGCRNKEIARLLNTTEQVIKNSLHNIFDKTGFSDRIELAMFTIHHKCLAKAASAMSEPIAYRNQKHKGEVDSESFLPETIPGSEISSNNVAR